MCLQVASCCGVSLETGSQLISIVSMLVSALLTALYGWAASLPLLTAGRNYSYTLLASAAGIQLLLAALLVVGVFRNKPSLLCPWLAYSWLCSGCLLVLSVAGMVTSARADSEAAAVISAYFVYAVLQYYCACVVYSRRRQVRRDREGTESAHSLMGKHS